MKRGLRQLVFLALAFLVGTGTGAAPALALDRIVPNDQFYANQWYLDRISAPEAWSRNTGSGQAVVAILDTGVKIDHPDLRENIWVNKGEIPANGIDDDQNGYVDDINGWDFTQGVADPSPKFEEGYIEAGIIHGTSVASIVAARGHNRTGITGVSWVNKIMPLRVLSSNGTGSTPAVIKAIEYATANGADVINLSFAGETFDAALLRALREAYHAGVVVVVAAGNAEGAIVQERVVGIDLDEKAMYPVCFGHRVGNKRMMIGVAALDVNEKKSSFSNYSKNCVDIAAPGERFFTAYVKETNRPPFTGDYAGYFEGTSVAAPVVAGAASIVRSILPDSSPDEVYEILTQTADSVEAQNPSYSGQLGAGRVNLAAAVEESLARLGGKSARTAGPAEDVIIAAPQGDHRPEVKVFDSKGNLKSSFLAYAESFTRGLRVAAADFDADGQADIVTAPNAGGGPHIRIFTQAGEPIGQFFAFEESFRGGVSVAAGDIDSDGTPEIIVVPQSGMGPEVKVFDSKGNLKSFFLAYGDGFTKGLSVSIGDFDADGQADIVTAPNAGGGPHVRSFRPDGGVVGQFFAFDADFRGGIDATGAGSGLVVAAPQGNYQPEVRLLDFQGQPQNSFLAYAEGFTRGFQVATGDFDTDGQSDIVTAPNAGGGPHVRIFTQEGEPIGQFFAFDPSWRGGVNIALP